MATQAMKEGKWDETPKMYGCQLEGKEAVGVQKIAAEHKISMRDVMHNAVTNYLSAVKDGLEVEGSRAGEEPAPKPEPKKAAPKAAPKKAAPKATAPKGEPKPLKQPARSEMYVLDAAASTLGLSVVDTRKKLEAGELAGSKEASTWTVFLPNGLDALPKEKRLQRALDWTKSLTKK